jgi:tripartite-type tricarboxylate transporter receptor subunit TctC
MLKKLLLALAVLCSIVAQAQSLSYPTRPVRIVIPFGPGGGNDLISRVIARHLSEMWKQPVVVENRPGGNTTVGVTAVARATPDGYTLLGLNIPDLTVASTTSTEVVSYKWDQDLIPVGHLGVAPPFVAVVNSKLNVKNLMEFQAYGNNKKYVSYSSAGIGNIYHIYGAMLVSSLGLDSVHIPYNSGQAAVNDVLTGNVDLVFAPMAQVLQHVQVGTLTAIAALGDRPPLELPDVQPIGKSRFSKFINAGNNYVLWAPVGTPDWIVSALRKDIAVAQSRAREELVTRKLIDGNIKTVLTPEQIITDGKLWVRLSQQVVQENR